MPQGNKQVANFPDLWDQVAPNWWYRRTGSFEVHISADPDLGWEISVLENAQPHSRPTFRKDFGAAVGLAEWLFEHYESKQEKLAA